jgi:hypothetical protein
LCHFVIRQKVLKNENNFDKNLAQIRFLVPSNRKWTRQFITPNENNTKSQDFIPSPQEINHKTQFLPLKRKNPTKPLPTPPPNPPNIILKTPNTANPSNQKIKIPKIISSHQPLKISNPTNIATKNNTRTDHPFHTAIKIPIPHFNRNYHPQQQSNFTTK